MSPQPTIEQRLATLEAALVEVQSQLREKSADNWIARFTGLFKDEPAFAEVVEEGRKYRESLRPSEDATP